MILPGSFLAYFVESGYTLTRTPSSRDKYRRPYRSADQTRRAHRGGHNMPFSPGNAFFEYRITRTLGQGAFGTVYLAQDTLLDRPVAIKELTAAAQADPVALPAFPPRSSRGGQPESPEHRHRLRPEADRRRSLPGDGVSARRQPARPAEPARPAAGGGCGAYRRGRVRRAGGGPRQRHRASRRQAGEHPADGGRPGEGRGLRDRARPPCCRRRHRGRA